MAITSACSAKKRIKFKIKQCLYYGKLRPGKSVAQHRAAKLCGMNTKSFSCNKVLEHPNYYTVYAAKPGAILPSSPQMMLLS